MKDGSDFDAASLRKKCSFSTVRIACGFTFNISEPTVKQGCRSPVISQKTNGKTDPNVYDIGNAKSVALLEVQTSHFPGTRIAHTKCNILRKRNFDRLRMLLKSADTKEGVVSILTNLLNHPSVPEGKKQLIDRELRNIATGIKTEKEAAYEIDFHFGATKNLMVIHDLRIEVNGRVAQIDHLLINRLCQVYVLETKTFGSGLSINDKGEFSTTYDGRRYGIPSPIEQNARHISVLRDAFKSIGMPKRLGVSIQPSFLPVVLVSQNAVIERPNSKKSEIDSVIKLDQFFSWFNKEIDQTKPFEIFNIVKFCKSETIQNLAEKLLSLDRPIRTDYIKKFDLSMDLLVKKNPEEISRDKTHHRDDNGDATRKIVSHFCESPRVY